MRKRYGFRRVLPLCSGVFGARLPRCGKAPWSGGRTRLCSPSFELLSPFLPIALFLATAPAPDSGDGRGEALSIRLDRPFRVGQVFSYAAVGRTYRQTVVSTEGAVVNESVRGARCELAGALSIDEVGEDGRPRALSLKVFRLVMRDGFSAEDDDADLGKQPLASGTELSVRFPHGGAAEPEVAVAAGPELDPGVVAALLLVLPRPAARNHDALFGRQAPAKHGERWPIDASGAARALATGGIEVEPERLVGEARITADEEDSGAYQVEVTLRGSRAGVPLPRGYATRAGELHVRLGRTLPEDPSLPLLREEEEYSLHGHALGREGDRLLTVDMAFHQTLRARYQEIGEVATGAAD